MDRVQDCGSWGCGFESRRAHWVITLSEVEGWGRIVDDCAGFENQYAARYREFESHPHRNEKSFFGLEMING